LRLLGGALRWCRARFPRGWLVVCLVGLAGFPVMAAPKAANVLVLYSNGRLLPANVEGDRGLREALVDGTGHAVNVFDEFLDIPRFSGPAYFSAMTAYLHQKYGPYPPDVIVVGGAEALVFALEQRAALFPKAPIVHMSIPKAFLGTLPELPPDVVGTPIEFDFGRTIEQARRWHPRARRLVLVTGTAAQDRAWEARLREATPRLEQDWETVEFLAGLPTSAVIKHLEKLPGESVVFTPGYWQDGEGRRFTPRESAQALVTASSAPVYAPFNTFVGIGIVGGYMLDFEGIGRQAGRTVKEVLHGAAPVTTTMPNVLNVDWRQVRRWGIVERAVPGDATVHFREPGLWDVYRREVLIALAVVLVQSGLIAGLIVERRRRKLAVRAEQKQRFELVHASRVAVVGELTGAIAHEINQPLGAILSNAEAAEMILASDAPQPAELRQILADIRRDDLRASEVIRRLRALLVKHQVEHRRFDLNEAVGDVESILRAEARRRGATLEIHLPLPAATMVGDRIQIQQVLINLVLNALEAVADLPEPQRRVGVTVEKKAGRVTLVVRDRGSGITPEQMPRLFDSFFSTKSTGMGLGLSIVRTLVEAHGGRVTADNGVDGGAVFRVELPAAGANGKKIRETT
jgi:signal transduction histidine kinase